ncbi:uncharacterized protein [Coffea arabica]|uniref:ATP-dependent DNA helicase n=1 Tax=Coffea arabica TaxID=13443 RepID=A0A6P6VKS0_COFAR|nr:ATP-dependent DNA helicase PIF1-like [Coffea arabica]
MGLLQSDTHLEDTLNEAAAFQMFSSLRTLFAILLAYCSPSNPRVIWEKYEAKMSRDFERVPDGFILSHDERLTREIWSELRIQFTEQDLLLPSKLNIGQRYAYDVILQEVFSSGNSSFFVDGPGGTSKTFLYRSILATLRSQGFITIVVASSGVAASIIPGEMTAHSRFKISLDIFASKVCHISKQSSVAKLIIMAKLILWDEVSMAKRDTIEVFDRLLRDVMDSNLPFGGKVVVFGGDFHQTLPVIQNATKDQQIEASSVNSPLWSTLRKLILTENMRDISDSHCSDFLLRIGEGCKQKDEDGKITLSKDISIPFDNKVDSLNRLMDFGFLDLSVYSSDPYQITNRCILTSKNTCVDDINEMIIDRFPGQPFV